MTLNPNPHWENVASLGYEQAARACWDEPPETWDAGVAHALAQIEPYLPASGTVLEIGCGVGRLLFTLAKKHPFLRLVGLDSSPAMLAHALDVHVSSGVVWIGNTVELVDGDGHRIPSDGAFQPLGPFAGAYSVLCFQHLDAETTRGYIAQVGARLVPGAAFRFQLVHVGDSGPLSFIHPVLDVTGWCLEAGLTSVTVTGDPVYPTWRWVTARKL